MTQLNQVRNKGIEVDIIVPSNLNITLTANYSISILFIQKILMHPNLLVKDFQAFQDIRSIHGLCTNFRKENFRDYHWLAIGTKAALLRETDVPGVRIPDFIKLDASIMYQHKKWFVRGIFDNLANRRYIAI